MSIQLVINRRLNLDNVYFKQIKMGAFYKNNSINLFGLFMLALFSCTEEKKEFLQPEIVQLAAPKISIDSILFRNSAKIDLAFDLERAEIFYSINEDLPQLYEFPFEVRESSLLQVQVKKEGFIESEIIRENLIKISDKTKNATIKLNPSAHQSYPGGGAISLIDFKKGSTNFRAGNLWSGFQSKEIIIELNFEKPIELKSVILSLLTDHRSWIFLPEMVQIFSGGKLIGEKSLEIPEKEGSARLEFITTDIKSGNYSSIEIHILSERGIPEWHAGKGTQSWLFIDEILIE